MKLPLKIVCIVGTRPEAIKMAPVIRALQCDPTFSTQVLATAQHRQMLDTALADFGIAIDNDLDLMKENQSLSELTGRLFPGLSQAFERAKPDLVLAQGDTTTVFVASVVAFYQQLMFGHIEAGLRTHDFRNPFPEEFNRFVAGRLASVHFAPTDRSRCNLIEEGVRPEQIFLTGNTVIDALLYTAARNLEETTVQAPARRRILMTAHRRENFGVPMESIFHGVADLVQSRDDVEVLYPVHPNPQVTGPARAILGKISRVRLVAPLSYPELVAELKACHIVLTDSGGLQEEAPALGKPVLVMRKETERPEAIKAGVAKLIGADRRAIVTEITRLLDDPEAYSRMSKGISPYGDGRAAVRIVAAIKGVFGLCREEIEDFNGA